MPKTAKPRQPALKLYWHIHHQILLEPAHQPIKDRVVFIKAQKAPREIPTRLRCLKRVKRPDLLPAVILKIIRDYIKSGVRDEMGLDLTMVGHERAWNRVMARHRREYPRCNCDEYGELVFS